ncbi:SufBD protein [Agathobaculum sp.]|uniref:SufBD protein n=1 Tax=Agathobaculum sp. TaxID=2048138 RepID=UPI002A83559E|nr:SufBD protein [Agathobaculum sp.]MDY3618628.1 SufBD protein [Agathobaculum sp.]
MENLAECLEGLYCPKPQQAYRYFQQALAVSRESNAVFPFLPQFFRMAEDANSYIRTRGLLLIIANAKWDEIGQIDDALDSLLKHILDAKPITSRQFIQALPELAAAKPALAGKVCRALRQADVSRYPDSMAPLVLKDIRNTLQAIENADA